MVKIWLRRNSWQILLTFLLVIKYFGFFLMFVVSNYGHNKSFALFKIISHPFHLYAQLFNLINLIVKLQLSKKYNRIYKISPPQLFSLFSNLSKNHFHPLTHVRWLHKYFEHVWHENPHSGFRQHSKDSYVVIRCLRLYQNFLSLLVRGWI